MDCFLWKIPLKWMIWGYPRFQETSISFSYIALIHAQSTSLASPARASCWMPRGRWGIGPLLDPCYPKSDIGLYRSLLRVHFRYSHIFSRRIYSKILPQSQLGGLHHMCGGVVPSNMYKNNEIDQTRLNKPMDAGHILC